MNGLKICSFVFVLFLVLSLVNPVLALNGFEGDGDELYGVGVAPAVPVVYVVGPYAVTQGEALFLVLSGSAVIAAGQFELFSPPVQGTCKNVMESVSSVFGNFVNTFTHHRQVIVDNHRVNLWKLGTPGYADVFHRLNYYDDQKKGIPVEGNHGEAEDYHTMGNVGNPYSSRWLFDNAVDDGNGCPKQIRYFGKDGKPELDIDFSHGRGKDQCGKTDEFPHKHYWQNGVRPKEHCYGDIEEVIKNWRCKNYNFYRGFWC
jgi:hypothetical protein